MAIIRKNAKDKKKSEAAKMQQKRDLAAVNKAQGIIPGGSFAAAEEQPALNLKKR